MRYPEFLKNGDTIGFITPSFGCATEPYATGFDHALTRFHNLGFETSLGPNCRLSKGIGISNTPAACGEELNKAMCDPSADAIISVGGGELMCEVIPFMDFQGIKKAPPKWYMGYSDNTNYTYLSATLADTASIYGPCAASFGMEPWHGSLDDTIALLKGEKLSFSSYPKWELESLRDEEHPLVPYNLTEDTKVRAFVPFTEGVFRSSSAVPCKSAGEPFPGKEEVTVADADAVPAEDSTPAGHKYSMQETQASLTLKGRLLGGCLDCLVNLSGTRFDQTKAFAERYKEDGILWFLEACDLNVMSIRRSLWNLKEAGWFAHASGFLVGRPRAAWGENLMGLDPYEAVLGPLSELGVPILTDVDFGHLPPSIPIICGACATVTYKDRGIILEHQLT